MGNTTIKEIRKCRKGYDIVEMYVDDDLYKITEEYKDDEGEIIYVYEYYPTVGELFRDKKKKEEKQEKVKKNRPNNKINKKLDKIKNKYHN